MTSGVRLRGVGPHGVDRAAGHLRWLPDPELRAHVLAADGLLPRLSRRALHRAMDTLTAPDPEEGQAWQAV